MCYNLKFDRLTAPSQKETSVPDEKPQSNQVVETDLEPSEGLEFESNGDGTCTITGIGTCTDRNIVIPLESPDGDTVTLIGKYALYSLENVNSITLVNYTYEVDENAFQYGEFTAVKIIGGSSVINKSAFSSCEDLTSVVFTDSTLETEEYDFYSCEDLKSVTICENAKSETRLKLMAEYFNIVKDWRRLISGMEILQ